MSMSTGRHRLPRITIHRAAWVACVVLAAVAAGGCTNDAAKPQKPRTQHTKTPAPAPGRPHFALRRIGDFDQPVQMLFAPDSATMLVVEKTGSIVAVRGKQRSTILDMSQDISTASEQGLLGAALHPEFRTNGRLFLNYTDTDGDTHIAEQQLDPESLQVRGSMHDVLTLDQPYDNHNGGHLAFAPDGMLWIGTGDGGDGGDPENRAQNPKELFGKMLRIDIDHASGGHQYAIPQDNPRDSGFAPEIVAMGMRNPWRYSFDAPTHSLVIGDVGQESIEEIDAISATTPDTLLNLGWDVWEGRSRYEGNSTIGPGKLVNPIAQYTHDDGCSITGGVVYRGAKIPSLRGWYMYADFCQQWIRTMPYAGVGAPPKKPPIEHTGVESISSFATDARGEVYVTSLSGGVYRVAGT